MAMNVGGEEEDAAPISAINTTPLVDVMLVLLIIFLITVPVAIQTVPLRLPTVRNQVTETKAENLNLSVKAGPGGTCEVFWEREKVTSQELVDRSVEKLKADIANQGGIGAPGLELPEAHIRGDVDTPFKCIGGVVSNLQRAGFAKVGFISEPKPLPSV
ncbi:ExbD/TolR family protein [Sphingomonas sp.]|uniref:ExbD/TolR family protein n=1 Tax=Sphingomonas sp. TaxID=28214 RepID=UPI003B00A7D0